MFQQYKIQKEKQNSAVYKKKLSSTKISNSSKQIIKSKVIIQKKGKNMNYNGSFFFLKLEIQHNNLAIEKR